MLLASPGLPGLAVPMSRGSARSLEGLLQTEKVAGFHRQRSAARGTWTGYRGAAAVGTGSAARAAQAAAVRAQGRHRHRRG